VEESIDNWGIIEKSIFALGLNKHFQNPTSLSNNSLSVLPYLIAFCCPKQIIIQFSKKSNKNNSGLPCVFSSCEQNDRFGIWLFQQISDNLKLLFFQLYKT
jgi:hypothetical protein